ncbi:hypothetical protein BH10PAT1_BH10PAT1_0110 [soil metagenome]
MNNLTNTLFVFTTSPAGLGHIRVMDAIKDGKPNGITTVDIGIVDLKANRVHDLGSRVTFFRKLTEFYQTNPLAESFVTQIYTKFLRRHTQEVVKNFRNIAKEYSNYKTWVVISTHFALAHTISAAKEKLEKELGIKIITCVVVTDDSPQKIWAVKNSNLTFVASEQTKISLSKFFPKDQQDSVKAISFPIAQRLSQNMTTSEFQFVINQTDPKQDKKIQIEIPISGAAVQLTFFQKFIEKLSRENYLFTVIGQESMLTKKFFDDIQRLPRVQISVGKDSWQTVKFYESMFYQANRPSIEITKPSEQTFKAILNPRQRGGVILLLTPPIGRQEYDNLNFLTRNGLMPTEIEGNQLFVDSDLTKWIPKAKTWRAIKLPDDPIAAADFVKKLKANGIFYAMLSAVIPDKPELKDNGVQMIWNEIEKLTN